MMECEAYRLRVAVIINAVADLFGWNQRVTVGPDIPAQTSSNTGTGTKPIGSETGLR